MDNKTWSLAEKKKKMNYRWLFLRPTLYPIQKIIRFPFPSYPNPFSDSTNISFSIPQSQKVFIQVFDGAGRLIKTIANEQMQAGTHQLTWNAADENGTAVAKGMYYLKFNAGSYAETKKLAVIK